MQDARGHLRGFGPSHLDPDSLALEVGWGAEGRGPGVEVEQRGSGQRKQGDYGRGGQRGEEHLEEDLHDPRVWRADENKMAAF